MMIYCIIRAFSSLTVLSPSLGSDLTENDMPFVYADMYYMDSLANFAKHLWLRMRMKKVL